MTGGGKAPADFTENDINILRIIGESLVYAGVKDFTFDTRVERTFQLCETSTGVQHGSVKSTLLPVTSEMIQALNSGIWKFVD